MNNSFDLVANFLRFIAGKAEECFDQSQDSSTTYLLFLILLSIWPVRKYKIGKEFNRALVVLIIVFAVFFLLANRFWESSETIYNRCMNS
jgi:hypothetical protein